MVGTTIAIKIVKLLIIIYIIIVELVPLFQ